MNFIFLELSKYYSAVLINTRFPEPICPLFFANSRLEYLKIHHLLNSYYKKNLLRFIKNSSSYNQSIGINSHIKTLELNEFYGLDLDLLNRDVFKDTNQFAFDGVIRSIENDVFKPFRDLTSIMFNPKVFLDLVRRQGIEWIKQANDDLHINITDPGIEKERTWRSYLSVSSDRISDIQQCRFRIRQSDRFHLAIKE